MRARLRQVLTRLRELALGPALHRLDILSERMDEMGKRLSDLEAVLQAVEGRAATVTERSVAQQESQARLDRRVEEIEKLLSER